MDNNIAIDDLIKALREATEVEREKTDLAKKTVEQEEKDLQKSVERTAGYTRINGKLVSLEQQRINVEAKLNKELEAQFGATKKLATKQEAAFNEQLKQLNYMIDYNGRLVKTTIELDSAQTKLLRNLKKKDDYDAEMKKRQDKIGNDLKNGLAEIGKASWGTATKLAKGETSFSTLIPIVDAVGNAAAAVSKGLFSMIPVIGGFLGSMSEAVIKAGIEGSKFALEMLDRSLKTFQELADSGALVATGMTGLNKQLEQSGMSLDGFKRVVKENGKTLAAWGGTVGEGATMFSKAVGDLSLTEVGDDLRRLGLNADAMGESAAAFLEQEIRMGRGRNMTQKQLTDGTVQYVKELDLLQKVTGLSRQDAQKQRDELMSDSRYRASVEGMNKENQNALNALMMQFKDPNMKRGLMDLASGAITTADAGMVMQALGENAADAIQAIKEANPEELPKVMDKVQRGFQEAAKNNIELFGEAYKYLETGTMINSATIFDIANGKYVTSMENAVKTQSAQLKAEDELTEQTVKAQKEMDKLANSALQASNALLPYAADAVKKFTESLNKAIAKVKELLGPSSQNVPSAAEAGKNTETAVQMLADAESQVAQAKPNSAESKAAKENLAKARSRVDQTRKIEDTAKTNESLKLFKEKGFGGNTATQGSARRADSTIPPSSTSDDVMKLIQFQGDALGNKSHFDGLNSDVKSNFMSMIAEYGKTVQVNSGLRSTEEQQKLWDEGTATANPNIRMRQGKPVARPGYSKHQFGRAIDLNSSQVADLKSTGLLSKYGFNTIDGDPPHIEMARLGGVFNGPVSGYPVMLHGREAVVPNAQFEAMQNVMNSVTKNGLDSTTSDIANTGSASTATVEALRDLYDIMSDKLDTVIDKLASGNDIQDKLLRNSMV